MQRTGVALAAMRIVLCSDACLKTTSSKQLAITQQARDGMCSPADAPYENDVQDNTARQLQPQQPAHMAAIRV